MSTTAPQPAATIRDGKLKVTVWKNESSDNKVFYNTELTNSYEKDGKWTDTNRYTPTELLKAQRLLGKAYDFIAEQGK